MSIVCAKPRLLLIDDERSIRVGVSRYLSRAGFRVDCASTLNEGEQTMRGAPFEAILVDVNLPDGSALPWLRDLREQHPGAVIVVFSGSLDLGRSVEALECGADRFLTKPLKMEELRSFLLERVSQEEERPEEPHVKGNSAAMRRLYEVAGQAAGADVPVLIEGETGVGKGCLARWIHDSSPRRDAPFVKLNCAALRGELLRNELFGHARGAYTSAEQASEGLLQRAHGGTLFLDEIGEMELDTQVQLLDVLEDKAYRRLGETRLRCSDFRLLCATHKDLRKEVREGKFRLDLFYRIQVISLRVPALRLRTEEIPALVRSFCVQFGRPDVQISEPIIERLCQYPWPGNIRELRNAVERALVLARGEIAFDDLLGDLGPGLPYHPEEYRLEAVEELHIKKVMQICHNDTQAAASLLGISRASLYRRLKKIS